MEDKRKKNIEPVCTRDEARKYFADCGLTYQDIMLSDLWWLVDFLQEELNKSNSEHETGTTLRMNNRIAHASSENGIENAFLTVRGEYFKKREAVSFNPDGFIGFAGWADQGNLNPILRGFIWWCEEMKAKSGLKLKEVL